MALLFVLAAPTAGAVEAATDCPCIAVSQLLPQTTAGCLETLRVPQIRERLLSFWRDRYDPGNMTVCLVSSRSLDDLEVLLAEHFSGIRRAPDAVDGCEEAPPALFAATGIVHERKPVRDLRELRIMWPLPFGLRDDYRNGAERVVGHALGATPRHSFDLMRFPRTKRRRSATHATQATRARTASSRSSRAEASRTR